MEMREDDYILGIWFISWETGDWMLTAIKRDNKWLGEFRFRYCSDESKALFDGKDRKSFYTLSIEDKSEDEVRTVLNEMFEVFKKNCPHTITHAEHVPIEGSFEDFLMIMSNVSWCHIKTMKKEEVGNC